MPAKLNRNNRLFRHVFGLASPSLIICLAAVGFAQYRIPTTVEMTSTASAISFTTAGDRPSLVLKGGLTITSMSLYEFKTLHLTPKHLSRTKLDGQESLDGQENTAASLRNENRPLEIRAGSPVLRPRVVLEPSLRPADLETSLGNIDHVWLPSGSRVYLSRTSDLLSLRVTSESQEIRVALRGALRMSIEHSDVRSQGTTETAPFQQYDIEVGPVRPMASATARNNTLAVALELAPGDTRELAQSLDVTALEFQKQSISGHPESSIIESELSFPATSNPPRVLTAGEYLQLSPKRGFQLKSIGLNDAGSFRIQATGKVSNLVHGSEDLRRSALDFIVDHRLVSLVAAVALWVFPTTLAARKLIIELTGKKTTD